LEEVAQLFACVGAAEAVGAEHGVAAGNPSANLLGIQFDVVGGRHDRAFGAVEAGGDVRFFRRFGRVEQVPAVNALAIAGQFSEARATPDVGFHAPVFLEQVGGSDDFVEDRAGAEQLHARSLAFATF